MYICTRVYISVPAVQLLEKGRVGVRHKKKYIFGTLIVPMQHPSYYYFVHVL